MQAKCVCYAQNEEETHVLVFAFGMEPFFDTSMLVLVAHNQNFVLGIPTCWYLKTLKFALPPTQMLKFALPHTQTLNGSRWNIGHVGSPTRGAGVGHVDFILFVLFLVALGTQRKCDIQWNTGFRIFPV